MIQRLSTACNGNWKHRVCCGESTIFGRNTLSPRCCGVVRHPPSAPVNGSNQRAVDAWLRQKNPRRSAPVGMCGLLSSTDMLFHPELHHSNWCVAWILSIHSRGSGKSGVERARKVPRKRRRYFSSWSGRVCSFRAPG